MLVFPRTGTARELSGLRGGDKYSCSLLTSWVAGMHNNIHCHLTHVKPAHMLTEAALLASQTFPRGTGLSNMVPAPSLDHSGVTGRQVWAISEGIFSNEDVLHGALSRTLFH